MLAMATLRLEPRLCLSLKTLSHHILKQPLSAKSHISPTIHLSLISHLASTATSRRVDGHKFQHYERRGNNKRPVSGRRRTPTQEPTSSKQHYTQKAPSENLGVDLKVKLGKRVTGKWRHAQFITIVLGPYTKPRKSCNVFIPSHESVNEATNLFDSFQRDSKI